MRSHLQKEVMKNEGLKEKIGAVKREKNRKNNKENECGDVNGGENKVGGNIKSVLNKIRKRK